MAKEVSQETLEMVDEVLQEEDPEFMEELESINPEDLDNQQIVTVDAELLKKEKANGLWVRWISIAPHKRRVLLVASIMVLLAVPLFILSAFGLLTPQFSLNEIPSMASLADEVMTLDPSLPDVSISSLESDHNFTLKTREVLAQLKSPPNTKQFARCVFEINMASEEDRVYVSKMEKVILATISEVLTNSTMLEFEGTQGKERVKQKIFSALNKKLSGKVRSIHYSQILFQ